MQNSSNIMPIFCTGEDILFGTTDGKIGLVQIGERSASTKWEIDNDKKKGGTSLYSVFHSL